MIVTLENIVKESFHLNMVMAVVALLVVEFWVEELQCPFFFIHEIKVSIIRRPA